MCGDRMNKQIQVTQSSMPSLEEYLEEIKEVWDNCQLTNMGPKHKMLERMLVDYLGTQNIALFTNGHLALESIIAAFNLTGEVITTPFTFVSTTHSIVRNGLEPVFCDIKRDDYTMDVDLLESLVTDKTSAVIPVHVYGSICDIKAIERFAKKYNLKVIYDAAHAFAVKFDGISAANFGDASMFSFHATKVFNTIEGGAVTFSDSSLKELLEGLKNFGITGKETVKYIGGNAKMNEFQAAMGICNLRHIDEQIKKRQKLVQRYRERLDHQAGIKILQEQKGVDANYAYFPVVFDEMVFRKSRDEIYNRLREENIFARKYFYPLTSDFECYNHRFDSEKTPVAKYIAERVLCLPLYADLDMDKVDQICNIITHP